MKAQAHLSHKLRSHQLAMFCTRTTKTNFGWICNKRNRPNN